MKSLLEYNLSLGDSASHGARDEVLTFQPGEMSRTVLITLVDDDIVGESIEIFNIRLTAVPGQALDTAVQDGLAQVIVSDDDEGLCHNRLDTVDLEIFVQRNFHMINFRIKNFRRNDPLPH